VSPILVRPVREQLEHDRIIRLLKTKWRRRYEVGMNPAAEQNAPVGSGTAVVYPDLVLTSTDRRHKLEGVIEVETGESVNHLEALSQWVSYSRLPALFRLYVPAGMVDVARRLCEENQIVTSEIWSYHSVAEEVRFTLVHKSKEPPPLAARRTVRPTRHAAAHRKASTRSGERSVRSKKQRATRGQAKTKKARGRGRT
jgi:hypothetical protein